MNSLNLTPLIPPDNNRGGDEKKESRLVGTLRLP